MTRAYTCVPNYGLITVTASGRFFSFRSGTPGNRQPPYAPLRVPRLKVGMTVRRAEMPPIRKPDICINFLAFLRTGYREMETTFF